MTRLAFRDKNPSMLRLRAAAAALLLASAVEGTAFARPQITSGLTTGVGLTDLRAANGPRVAYHLGARAELILLRDKPRAMGIGPYVDVTTAAFDTFEGGGGVAWLLPVDPTAFVLSAGAFARASRFGWEPGITTTLFWGSRSYNYHSSYAIGIGLYAQGRYGLGDGQQADALLGVQLDLEYLTLPLLYLYTAIAH